MSRVKGIAAVVLNYKTWEDAVNCVNDLKAQDYADKHIVVVENGSGNDSAEQLTARFGGDPLVTVLISETNLGFARGNNLGIRYAHEKLGCDTVFVVNSDTRIPPDLFTSISETEFASVGVISPTVLDRNGRAHTFPVLCQNIKKFAKRKAVGLIKMNLVSFKPFEKIYEIKHGKADPAAEQIGAPADTKTDPSSYKYAIQGSAYFLTPDFFAHYKGLYPRTFLYWEEIDLLLMLDRAGLGTEVVETPAVIHYGQASTMLVASDFRKFYIRHCNRSMVKSLPLVFGMSEKRISKLIDRSEEYSV